MFRKNRKIWSKIISHAGKYSLFKDGDSVLLAVSGGPDSVCMAHFFAHYSGRHGIKAVICHVNHGLRGAEADKDENFVRKLGDKLGLETVIRRVETTSAAEKMRLSLEHAARKLRYKALAEAAVKKRCAVIATAHHLDDNAETIMLNLLRGTNPRGLLGIPVKRPLYGKSEILNQHSAIVLVRPLLCLTRKEILEYLETAGLSYRKDKTNEHEKFTRNWTRKKLFPLIETRQPRFKQHLLDLSFRLSKFIR